MSAPAQPVASPPASPSPAPSPSPSPAPAPASTQPTPTPASAPTNDAEVARLKKLIEAQDAVIREGTAAQNRTAAELQKMRGAMQPPPVPTDPKDFFKDPHGEVARVVKNEVAATIAPMQELLQQLVAGQSKTDALASYKEKYPQYNWTVLGPVVGQLADQARQRGATVDDNVMQVLVRTAIGYAATGEIEGAMMPPAAPAPASGAPAPALPAVVVTPPHLQPSVLPAPAPQPTGGAPRALTENEARLAREKGQSVEQFLAWLDVPPDQIVNFKAPGEK